MSERDPRCQKIVGPGLPWLRFPHRLESEYRVAQRKQAASAFRINSFYILLIYTLLISGIYVVAPESVRLAWLATYIWVGVIIVAAGLMAQVRALDRYFHWYTGLGSCLAVAISVAIPGLVGPLLAVQLAQAGVMYAVIIIYSMVGLRFFHALAAGWIGGVLGVIVGEVFGYGVDWQVLHRVYTGASLLGMFLAYTGEVRDRRMFFQQRQLRRHQRRTEAMAARLRTLSREDALTGLANRRMFDECLEREWRRCKRAGMPVTLMLIDVDRFKAYNDHYGHPAGDRCLRTLSGELARFSRRAGDVVARFGGEEFVLLYPEMDAIEARLLAERLCASVRGLEIPHEKNGGKGIITISIGLAVMVPTRAVEPDWLLDAADKALYQVKAKGRDHWRCYEAPTIRLVRD